MLATFFFCLCFCFFFFFSSRRRHTILQGDWSSDVCSSDLSALSTAIAWALGLLSGLGWHWSALVGGTADLFLALPFLPVTILVVAHLGPSPAVITMTVGLISWPAFARVMRVRVTTELAAGYIEAARAIGAPPTAILTRHV